MREYTWVLYDLAAVAILLYFTYTSARKGFLREVVGAAGAACAAIMANLLAPRVAWFIYDTFARDFLMKALSDSLQVSAQDTAPQWLMWISRESGSNRISDADSSAVSALESLIEGVLSDPILALLGGVCFFVLFSVMLYATRRIAHVFSGVNGIPVLGWLNTFFGGVLGILLAVVVVYILALAARLYILFGDGDVAWLNGRVIDEGYIFRYFYRLT